MLREIQIDIFGHSNWLMGRGLKKGQTDRITSNNYIYFKICIDRCSLGIGIGCQHRGQTIHLSENLILMNLLLMSCMIKLRLCEKDTFFAKSPPSICLCSNGQTNFNVNTSSVF